MCVGWSEMPPCCSSSLRGWKVAEGGWKCALAYTLASINFYYAGVYNISALVAIKQRKEAVKGVIVNVIYVKMDLLVRWYN
jgi:hypothetical protein